MEAFDLIYDIQMSSDGDLVVDNGDLALANGIEWFTQEVRKIVMTNNPEWKMHPNVGANLEDFAGQPNIREVAKGMETQVYDKVTAEHIHYPGKLVVRVSPVSVDSVVLKVLLEVGELQDVIESLVYDYTDGIVRPVEDEDKQRVNQAKNTTGTVTTESTNPYLARRGQI